MNEHDPSLIPDPGDATVEQQLVRAARDLMAMVFSSDENSVEFMDRRRLHTRVIRGPEGTYHVVWEGKDAEWVTYGRSFENPREAVFHAYQGPH